ncbi:TraR/DksA family transcriptional regulator [Vibrio barjaei]|uniref:TraR/DksA family transcriptional regulator n=1 Tax=Vibrio barjaei TaxID=1676683 RepID=UPI0022836EED|nr:TraR/DksA family transcriptional regulator [Vibrio barjaei]MCY9872328.1 TraR/DksA family transcriptional regulator [Vibrio barjaei]
MQSMDIANKTKLIELSREIKLRVETLKEEIKILTNEHLVEDGDVSQQTERMNMLRKEMNMCTQRMVNISAALELIREGDYGYCTSCGIEIEKQRLDVRPESVTCVACQDHIEKKSKHYASK